MVFVEEPKRRNRIIFLPALSGLGAIGWRIDCVAEDQKQYETIIQLRWLETPLVAFLGWALVAGCIVYPLQESRWPGVFTLLPILGAVMIVGARQGMDSDRTVALGD